MKSNDEPRRPVTALSFRTADDIAKARAWQVLNTEWDALVIELGRALELLDDITSGDDLPGRYLDTFLPRIAREWNEHIAVHEFKIRVVEGLDRQAEADDRPHAAAIRLVRSRYSLDHFIKAVHLYAARPRPTRSTQST